MEGRGSQGSGWRQHRWWGGGLSHVGSPTPNTCAAWQSIQVCEEEGGVTHNSHPLSSTPILYLQLPPNNPLITTLNYHLHIPHVNPNSVSTLRQQLPQQPSHNNHPKLPSTNPPKKHSLKRGSYNTRPTTIITHPQH